MCLSVLSMHSHNGGSSKVNTVNPVAKRRPGIVTTARQLNNAPISNEPCLYVRPSLADLEEKEVQQQGRGIIQQRVFIIACNKLNENSYHKYDLQERILDLVVFTDNLRVYENDRVTGLLLTMPSHTIFVLEAGDDLLRNFCKELNNFAGEYWSAISIFQIEDLTNKVYFDTFVFRHLGIINNCEKPKKVLKSNMDDVALMRQHCRLSRNLHELCAIITHHMQTEEPTRDDILPNKTIEHLQLDATILDQVIISKKFYRSLESFVNLIHRVPFHFDDDLYDWEKPKIAFTIKDIFERSSYDVNLSFDVNNPIM